MFYSWEIFQCSLMIVTIMTTSQVNRLFKVCLPLMQPYLLSFFKIMKYFVYISSFKYLSILNKEFLISKKYVTWVPYRKNKEIQILIRYVTICLFLCISKISESILTKFYTHIVTVSKIVIRYVWTRLRYNSIF